MADQKIFTIELPAIPASSLYQQMADGQAKLALGAVAAMARSYWVSLAQERLKQRRRDFDDYWHAISQPEILPGMAVVTLTGKRAHDLEFGRPSYDLRKILLGPHVRVKRRGESGKGAYRNKKGGLYRPIPFAHQGPTGVGATGAPIGSAYARVMNEQERTSLAKWVWKSAKDLGASVEKANRRGVKWGERLPEGMAPKLRPHHTTSIYTSMYRVEKDYQNAKTGKTTPQSKFLTFRTISTSVQRGWIVPATTGLQLLHRVQQHLAKEAPTYLARLQSPGPGGAPPASPAPPPTT